MAKSTVAEVVDDIKVLADYNISDDDLDTLIIKAINFALKRIKQWLLDEGLYRQIGASTTLTSTANQEFIDISSTPADLDQPVKLTERENDSTIEVIPFQRYRELFPDPSADSTTTPDVAAFYGDRIYFGPRFSEVITIHFDYIKLITKVVLAGNIPFDDKYDELIVAIGIEYLTKFLDRTNSVAITSAKNDVNEIYERLIVRATKNIGLRRGSASRRGDISPFSPRKVI